MYKALRSGLIALLAVSAHAQFPLTPGDTAAVDRLFYQSPKGQLNGEVDVFKPFLDFAFRFEAGYTVRCPLRQFEGNASTLSTFLRITPDGGETVSLGESFAIPALPAAMRGAVNLRHFSDEAELSGVFALGEGTYHVHLLVIDGRRRAFEKSWNLTAVAHHKEKQATIAMKPNSASSAMLLALQENQKSVGDANSPRVTVLLDAAPIQPRSPTLRAWDRAFLLQSLSSLLGDMSYTSVRLVAFNLDQQQEIFRQDNFQRSDFSNLSAALRKLELGKVSYRTIQHQQGWSELLARLVNEEAASSQPADAVIFLGPHSRIEEKVPQEMLKLQPTAPHFFYFEYFGRWGADFPDTLHHLTNTCKGTVLKLHTPAELADGIRKMQRVLKESRARASAYSPATPLSSERMSDRQTGLHPPSNPSAPEGSPTPFL
jgi:hypothetical protein